MDCFSESSIHGNPSNQSEYTQNIYSSKEAADKALQKINLLYEEIMSPRNSDSEYLRTCDNTEESSLHSNGNGRNRYLKSCCNTVRELCAKCDKFLSQCISCNQCKCVVTYNNINKHNFRKNSSAVSQSSAPRQVEYKLNCTVPNPFSFYDRIEEYKKAKENKILKIKQDREKEIENEMKIRIHSKPVPKSTCLPLYNEMVIEREQHKTKRKEYCLEILNNTKPFHLQSNSKSSRKTKSSEDFSSTEFNFKAKPVPKHILSNKISEKLKNKEEIRKRLITERAKQSIEKSSSPLSQKPIIHSRSLIDLYSLNKTPNKESKSKNISEITNRLYIKKCNETLNNWNEKVLQVDTNKKMNHLPVLSDKKQSTKKLPFVYFPVRMSSAALLRAKLIRGEIKARTEREQKNKEEEIAKKRINSDIMYKLKDLIPPTEGEKEIEEKVKSFRESQFRRKQEYERELEEIRQRVSEQNLLLERHSKIKQAKTAKNYYSDEGSEVDDEAQVASDATHSIVDSPDEPRWPNPSESLKSEEGGEDDEEQESTDADYSNSDSYAVS